jgi:hypothetical protein
VLRPERAQEPGWVRVLLPARVPQLLRRLRVLLQFLLQVPLQCDVVLPPTTCRAPLVDSPALADDAVHLGGAFLQLLLAVGECNDPWILRRYLLDRRPWVGSDCGPQQEEDDDGVGGGIEAYAIYPLRAHRRAKLAAAHSRE